MRGGFKVGENLSGAMWPVNLATGTSGKSIYGCDLNTQTRLFNFGFGLLGAAGALSSIAEEGAAFKAAKPDGCFVAGTAVSVSEGGVVLADVGTSNVHYKAIEDIRVNDVVVSRNIQTGKTENKKVVKVHKHLDHETITVALADPSGKVVERITATTEHPFYVEGRGMVSLSQLGIGTQIVTRAGPTLTVKSAIHENHSHGVLVYNFEVEGDHTYFVGMADGGAWVHNDSLPKWVTSAADEDGVVTMGRGTNPGEKFGRGGITPSGWGAVHASSDLEMVREIANARGTQMATAAMHLSDLSRLVGEGKILLGNNMREFRLLNEHLDEIAGHFHP